MDVDYIWASVESRESGRQRHLTLFYNREITSQWCLRWKAVGIILMVKCVHAAEKKSEEKNTRQWVPRGDPKWADMMDDQWPHQWPLAKPRNCGLRTLLGTGHWPLLPPGQKLPWLIECSQKPLIPALFSLVILSQRPGSSADYSHSRWKQCLDIGNSWVQNAMHLKLRRDSQEVTLKWTGLLKPALCFTEEEGVASERLNSPRWSKPTEGWDPGQKTRSQIPRAQASILPSLFASFRPQNPGVVQDFLYQLCIFFELNYTHTHKHTLYFSSM